MKQSQNIRIVTIIALAVMALCAKAQEAQQWWGYWNTTMGLQQVGELDRGSNVMGVRLTAQNT